MRDGLLTMVCTRSFRTLLNPAVALFDGDPDVAVSGIAYDSRQVEPGNVFVAVPGFVHDGIEFVPDALQRGAMAIVAERPRVPNGTTADPQCWVTVENARRALADMACVWYDNPSRDLTVVGVTGTNGKTTVTALLEAILAQRAPVGRWSTTRVRIGGESFPTPRTTPESLELQRSLARMLEVGCWAATIEVSSHALRLERVTGTRFAAAVFTNLSPDHLDFHADMDDYLDAKATLFAGLEASAPAVLNVSDPAGRRLAKRTTGRVVGYGWHDVDGPLAPQYAIRDWRRIADGSRLRLHTPAGELELATCLIGRANAENIAAAVAMAMELRIDVSAIAAAVRRFEGEPGRLQAVDRGQPFTVLVDFAHTPGALQAALEAATTTLAGGRLTVIFGCGGDRDRAKRPLMGKIAATTADRVVVTSDNPRSEDPEAIIEQILTGMPTTSDAEVVVEPDRRRAIEHVIQTAGPGDCVLIAGKGHETEQVFADRAVPFDDTEVATTALRRRPEQREVR